MPMTEAHGTKMSGVRTVHLRWVLGAGAWIWIAALVLAPASLFPVGRFICHQRPERSFFVAAQQMPVCARCAGLYTGAALAIPAALAMALPLAPVRARRLLVLAAGPTAITWMLEFAGLAHFGNWTRFLAGVPLGCAAAWLVVSALSEAHRRTPGSGTSAAAM